MPATPFATRALFDQAGYALIPELIEPATVHTLLVALGRMALAPLRGGIRGIDKLAPPVARLARSRRLVATAEKYLDGRAALVRAIYFDKSPENNWFVTWHQDQTVAVSTRFDAPGWGPWSIKAGSWHVQPPLEVLEQMVTIRVHLDAATPANGCLLVLPGSHRLGLLRSAQVRDQVDPGRVVSCASAAGGAVVMRPHILHASGKSTEATRRRILHFEYASYHLPHGAIWNA